jgi:hypothetical protein
MPVGRPIGRPKGSGFGRTNQMMVRLNDDELGWVRSKLAPKKTQSDVIRDLIEAERKRERRRSFSR